MKLGISHVLLVASCVTLVVASAPARIRAEGAEESIAVFVNLANHTSRMSTDELAAVFSLSKRQWDSGQSIVVFNLQPRTPVRETFDRAVLGMDASETSRFWIDRRVRGKGDAPTKVPTAALMVQVIAKLPSGIGYAPNSSVTPQVRVVARIVGGKVLAP